MKEKPTFIGEDSFFTTTDGKPIEIGMRKVMKRLICATCGGEIIFEGDGPQEVRPFSSDCPTCGDWP